MFIFQPQHRISRLEVWDSNLFQDRCSDKLLKGCYHVQDDAPSPAHFVLPPKQYSAANLVARLRVQKVALSIPTTQISNRLNRSWPADLLRKDNVRSVTSNVAEVAGSVCLAVQGSDFCVNTGKSILVQAPATTHRKWPAWHLLWLLPKSAIICNLIHIDRRWTISPLRKL